MGRALAEAALAAGHEVTIVTGPVQLDYPAGAEVIEVVSTEEMLEASRQAFVRCAGLIGVAAPCDYRPIKVEANKIKKTGDPLVLNLIETPDIVATLAAEKTSQWIVGFALETDDPRLSALAKLERKSCDLVVLNGPEAMHAAETRVEVLDPSGQVAGAFSGPKKEVAAQVFAVIQERLIQRRPVGSQSPPAGRLSSR